MKWIEGRFYFLARKIVTMRVIWGKDVHFSLVQALWEFRGVTPDVRATLVVAPYWAGTRPARTPRNPEDPQSLPISVP